MKNKVGKLHHNFGTELTEEHKNLISKGNSKKVIDDSTKIVYDSIKIASLELKINVNTLRAMLTNRNPNKTKIRYLVCNVG